MGLPWGIVSSWFGGSEIWNVRVGGDDVCNRCSVHNCLSRCRLELGLLDIKGRPIGGELEIGKRYSRGSRQEHGAGLRLRSNRSRFARGNILRSRLPVRLSLRLRRHVLHTERLEVVLLDNLSRGGNCNQSANVRLTNKHRGKLTIFVVGLATGRNQHEEIAEHDRNLHLRNRKSSPRCPTTTASTWGFLYVPRCVQVY